MNSDLKDPKILKNHFDYPKSKLFQPFLQTAEIAVPRFQPFKRVQEFLFHTKFSWAFLFSLFQTKVPNVRQPDHSGSCTYHGLQ